MAGIGYTDRVVIYNRAGGELGSELRWYGVVLDHVRIEMTEAKSIAALGSQDANICTFKIYDRDLPVPYRDGAEWAAQEDKTACVTFAPGAIFIVAEKADMNRHVDPPSGELEDEAYNGLLEYLRKSFGMVYQVNTIDHYSLIPHWHIGGK